MLLVAALVAPPGGCSPHRAHVARVTPTPCLASRDSIAMNAARNAVADRLAGNRHRLPWTDPTPPTPISDAAVCARAADAYARAAASGASRGQSPRTAGVVRAGGLYFVVSPPVIQAGEFMIVGVLDAEFRWLVGLTT